MVREENLSWSHALAELQFSRCLCASVVLLALSSSVILRYQTGIDGADTNSLFMGREKDQCEDQQKVTSAVQIYRLIIKAKSKVKRDNSETASYQRESANICSFLGTLKKRLQMCCLSLNLLWLQEQIWVGFCSVHFHSRAYLTSHCHGNIYIYQLKSHSKPSKASWAVRRLATSLVVGGEPWIPGPNQSENNQHPDSRQSMSIL